MCVCDKYQVRRILLDVHVIFGQPYKYSFGSDFWPPTTSLDTFLFIESMQMKMASVLSFTTILDIYPRLHLTPFNLMYYRVLVLVRGLSNQISVSCKLV